jgi:hypothetical protein
MSDRQIKRSNSFRLSIIGLLFLNAVILWLGYRHFSQRPTLFTEDLPAYDTQLSALSGELSYLKADWRLLVLTILNSDSPDPKLRYLNVLYRTHRDEGLEVAAVYKGTSQQGKKIRHQFDLSFPILNDIDERLEEAVHISAAHSHSGILSIDSSYYSSNPQEFFRQNEQIPSLKVQELNSSTVSVLDSNQLAGRSLVIFLADCPTCQIERYMRQLAALEPPRDVGSKGLIAVFSPNFSSDSIIADAQRYGVTVPIYYLREQGFHLQNDYVTRHRLGGAAPLVVSCDDAGVVRRINSLFSGEQ